MGTSGHRVCNLLRESSWAALRKRGLEEKPGEAPPAWIEEAEEEEEEESNRGEGRIPWGQTPGTGPRPEVYNPKLRRQRSWASEVRQASIEVQACLYKLGEGG